MNDNDDWGPPTFYDSKRERDSDARINRCLGGIRTHSWTETKAEVKARLTAPAEPGREEGD